MIRNSFDRSSAGPQPLCRAWALFLRQPSPIAIGAVMIAATAGRLYVGDYSSWDLLPPAVVIAVHPFTEWMIHVFLLHFRPTTVGGYRVDPLVSRKHRAHHADPKDLELVFIPTQALAGLLAGTAAVFLIHSSYRPRDRVYRYIWRAHRNHHYRNERYWFGVTMHFADHVLGTFPERSAVELSPTARTLGVEA